MSIGNLNSDAELGREEEISTRSLSSRDVAAPENANHQSRYSSSSQRSLVAGRFMNMLHAHDDARVMFLSAHQTRTR